MPKQVAVIGAGPAGLMAAEVLVAHGLSVSVYDAMPSAGRKFLQAGRGGLNISHSLHIDDFLQNYYEASTWLAPMVRAFDATAIQSWMSGLGIASFVGSSGRIFPTDKKAAPLLRAWLHRLKQSGVVFHMKHRFVGWQGQALLLDTPTGQKTIASDAMVLALGGASWPQLGSKGDWLDMFALLGIEVAPFRPANCSFNVAWSEHMQQQYAGFPIKPVALTFQDANGRSYRRQGELMVSSSGLEGGLIYGYSALLREAIVDNGPQTIQLDLLPSLSLDHVRQKLMQAPQRLSLSNKLTTALKLSAVKVVLIQESLKGEASKASLKIVAERLKHYPIQLTGTGLLAEAISSAGGVKAAALDEQLMLNAKPGVFCVGEMLDWEAPTGGYLLTASLATARWGAQGVVSWLNRV